MELRNPTERAPATKTVSSARRCLLHEGDPTDLAAEWNGLETEKGNRVAVRRAWAMRLNPGLLEPIITAPIKADASRYLVAPARSGWGLGGVARLSIDRAAVGLLVSPPPKGVVEVGFVQHEGGRGAWVSVGVMWRRRRPGGSQVMLAHAGDHFENRL